jgi:hypothetical protein
METDILNKTLVAVRDAQALWMFFVLGFSHTVSNNI